MKRLISALVQDKPGVMNRISSLFRRRGFNIESIAVGPSEQEGFSRMTIVAENAPTGAVDQLTKQLYKVIEVVRATDITEQETVAKETIFVKVRANSEVRADVIRIAEVLKAEVADIATESMILELTGDTGQIARLLDLLTPFGIKEIVRTGQIAITRGE